MERFKEWGESDVTMICEVCVVRCGGLGIQYIVGQLFR